MSCWRHCSCTLSNVDEKILQEAAKKMELSIDTSIKTVGTSYGNYERNTANVDGAFVKNGRQLQLGYLLKGAYGKFEIIGDFYSTGLDPERFIMTLGQLYQEINIQIQAELMGYTVDHVGVNAEGDTEIEIYQWA